MQLTQHPKINKVVHELELPDDFEEQLASLADAAVRDDEDEIRLLLSRLVPTYEAGAPRERVAEEACEEAEAEEEEKPGLRVVKEEEV